MLWLPSLLLIMQARASTYTPEALLDQVHNLPGISDADVPFNHFSGYLTIKNTKQMHYWFMESERNPYTDALSFWTNGGPVSNTFFSFFVHIIHYTIHSYLCPLIMLV